MHHHVADACCCPHHLPLKLASAFELHIGPNLWFEHLCSPASQGAERKVNVHKETELESICKP
jgi:hypothetical protein